eukprot:gene9289-biopygen22703
MWPRFPIPPLVHTTRLPQTPPVSQGGVSKQGCVGVCPRLVRVHGVTVWRMNPAGSFFFGFRPCRHRHIFLGIILFGFRRQRALTPLVLPPPPFPRPGVEHTHGSRGAHPWLHSPGISSKRAHLDGAPSRPLLPSRGSMR